jgi:hypothetical protein
MPLGANKAAIMGVAGVSTGDVVLISSQTASGDSALTFDSGITSTYGEYIFKYYNINPATDNVSFSFQANAASGSGYNETITSTAFRAIQKEDDSQADLAYDTTNDIGQGTGFQVIMPAIGNGGDESASGELHLFNPSSTTYVKHFLIKSNGLHYDNTCVHQFIGGYFNTTSAIDDIQFKMSSGNFDGTIKMWGVKAG